MLDREEACALLAVIDPASLTGFRDRALIGVMIYTFARIWALLQMNADDVTTARCIADGCAYMRKTARTWTRCHHKLEIFLDEYLAAASLRDTDAALFPTTGRKTGTAHRMSNRMTIGFRAAPPRPTSRASGGFSMIGTS